MSLGGGTFLTQNKVAPGVYINFVSTAQIGVVLAERGTVALAMELDWGATDTVFLVENSDFIKNSLKIFGYGYNHAAMKGLRDLFSHAKKLYAYRLNGGVKAENTYATARYSGIRGNALSIVVIEPVEEGENYTVRTLLDGAVVDEQTVAAAANLQDNDFVQFKANLTLTATAGSALSGGTNGSAVTGTAYQSFLSAIEVYRFDVLGCLSTDNTIQNLFVTFTRRMREECGIKFQTVLYRKAADYEGIINLKNTVLDTGAAASELVYWLAGRCAGCKVNESNTNRVYDGEYSVDVNFTQTQLEQAVVGGSLVLHQVGNEVRIFTDINSLVSFTQDKGQDFQSNQVVRLLDQMGNDIAALFQQRYLGLVQNNRAGRTALWNDVISYNNELVSLGAIGDFDAAEITVEAGASRNAVVVTNPVFPIMAMEKLYMTVLVQ